MTCARVNSKAMGNPLQQPRFFTCQICTEQWPSNKEFKNKNLCAHPFCEECIAKYVEAKVQGNGAAKIQCPALDCTQLLDPFSCRPKIPSSLFTKWCDLLCDDYVVRFERSYCPNRKCMALVVNENCDRIGTVKRSACPSCKTQFCFQCKLPWHAGYRCEESGNLRERNDVVFGQLVERRKWRRCPGCGSCVERVEGCKRMRCRCSVAFCYDCGRKHPFECECADGHCIRYMLILTLIFFVATVAIIILDGQIIW